MKFLLIGDTHGHYLPLINLYLEELGKEYSLFPEAVLHVGDIGMYGQVPYWYRIREGMERFNKWVIAVYGNHEQRRELDNIWNGNNLIHNFHLIPEFGSLHTEHRGDESISIMGLGGAWTPPNAVPQGLPFDNNDALRAILRWESWGRPNVDILMTHEAPNNIGPIGDSRFGNPYSGGQSGIRHLWEAVRPKLLICGHYHRRYMYEENGLRMTILPEAKDEATVLDTETWTLTPFKMKEGINEN